MVDRLSRLEAVIQRIQHDNSGGMAAGEQPSSMDELGHGEPTPEQETTATIDQQLGHLMINENRSYYISNALWTSLSHEVNTFKGSVYLMRLIRIMCRLRNCAT